MITQAFILCAGKATRLYPLTLEKPKCLLELGNSCVLDHILEWLSNYNIDNFICNAYWKSDLIKKYAEVSKYKLKIFEENDILGTCGGVLNAESYLEDNFIIIYGDTVTNVNLNKMISFYNEVDADLLIISKESDTPWECGVIEYNSYNKVTDLKEKPPKDIIKSKYTNGGILICKKKVFSDFKHLGLFDISYDLIPTLLKNNYNIYHKPIEDYEILIDMGTFKNYELARQIYDNNKNST